MTTARLAEGDDLAAAFPETFGRLELRVDVLEIEGVVAFPGRSVDVQARRVVVTGTGPAVLDVSGMAVAQTYDPDGADAAPDGTPAKPNGQPGAPGDAGDSAGDVTIVAGEVIGHLEVRANGADGGNGQRGGNGAQPPRPDGVDAVWKNSKKPELGSSYGGKRLQWGAWWVAWGAGEAGHPAVKGGDAGAGGSGGAGGDGGRIVIRASNGIDGIDASAAGGAGGRTPVDATPGPPSDPGHGGRNRIYYTAVGQKKQDNWVGTTWGEFPYYKKKHNLANNNKNSTVTAAPGVVPPPPEPAVSGTGPEPVVSTVSATQLRDELDQPLLELVLTRADRSGEDDPDQTLQRYRWVFDLTEGAASDELQALHGRARAGLQCPWPRVGATV